MRDQAPPQAVLPLWWAPRGRSHSLAGGRGPGPKSTESDDQPPTLPMTIYCPHCSRPFAEAEREPAPVKPVRCPHCRLLVGAGRGRPSPDRGQPGAAAGLIANEARRAGGGAEPNSVDRARASAAIVYVASKLGVAPDRLTLTVYREQLPGESSLPSVTDIVHAFGSWKQAQDEALELRKSGREAAEHAAA